MRKILLFAALCWMAVFLPGMGALAPKSDAEIPIPDENYSGQVTDKVFVVSKANNMSCGGETFLKAYSGKASVAIPFEKIQKAAFKDSEEQGYQDVTLFFWDGQEHAVRVKNILECSGRTELGPMRIRARDLSKIEFDKRREKKTDKEKSDEQR